MAGRSKLLTNGYVVRRRHNETNRKKDTRIGLSAGLSETAICGLRCCNLYLYFFFFSLFHQRADDEALTRFLQTSLFLIASPILVKSMFLSFRSSLTLSIQVFLCLPLLLFPSTC